MNIEFPTGFNSVPLNRTKESNAVKPEFSSSAGYMSKSSAKADIDHAAALLQHISMKLSAAVVREISPSEYMRLMAMINTMVNQSVDRQV